MPSLHQRTEEVGRDSDQGTDDSLYLQKNRMKSYIHNIKGKMWVPLGEYPSSRSQNITPYCPIQPLYKPYIGGRCWYVSRVLSQGYPTFPFDNIPYMLHSYIILHCRS